MTRNLRTRLTVSNLTRNPSVLLIFTILLQLLGFLSLYVNASSGNESSIYRNCVHVCTNSDLCQTDKNEWTRQFYANSENNDFSFVRKLEYKSMVWLQWTCEENCKYHCMWLDVDFNKKANAIADAKGKNDYVTDWDSIHIFNTKRSSRYDLEPFS